MSRLEPWADEVWTSEMPKPLLGADLRRRMTVVRMADGGLWVHSPIDLDDTLRSEIDALGPVRALVGPNRFHWLGLPAWKAAYPDAVVFGAPGLRERCPRAGVETVLEGASPWPDFDQVVVDGAPMMNEVVFLHRASGTVIVTDVVMHVRRLGANPGAWMMSAMGIHNRVSSMFTWMMARDRARLQDQVACILAWPFDRALLSHGENLRSGAKQALAHAFRWLDVPHAVPVG